MSRQKENIKSHRQKFMLQFLGLLGISFATAYVLGKIDQSKNYFEFLSNDYYKDILIALIGFLGVLVGFMFAGLSIFTSGLQSRYAAATDNELKKKLDSYWNYLIAVTKLPIFILIANIFFLILLLTFKCSIEKSAIHFYVLPFCVLISASVSYLTLDRVFDYFSNPF